MKSASSYDNTMQAVHHHPAAHDAQPNLLSAMQAVSETLAPLWPLRDYVATNPLDGLTDRPFLQARSHLRAVTHAETLMPMAYYREKYQQGFLNEADIRRAVTESDTKIPEGQILAAVRDSYPGRNSDTNDERIMVPLCELADRGREQGWREFVVNEVSRFCAEHYDEGIAAWKHPWRNLRIYESWRERARHHRSPEIQGLHGFRDFVRSLPASPDAAIKGLLRQIEVPATLWGRYLTSVIHLLPGWASWAMHAVKESEKAGLQSEDLTGLVAIMLAHEVAVAQVTKLQVNWGSIMDLDSPDNQTREANASGIEAEIRHLLQQAMEGVYRRDLVARLAGTPKQETGNHRPPVEAIFCIDVRSERLRRNLLTVDPQISTGGFAGFFGIPVSYQENREEAPRPYLPAILEPTFSATGKHPERGAMSAGWQQMRKSAAGAFGFVEAAGTLHLLEFARRGWSSVFGSTRQRTSIPAELHTCGGTQLSLHEKVDLAASVLTGLGRRQGHARLFVFCGHGASTANNPLNASLACGACGGHNGGVNAGLAARLLNDNEVRRELEVKGITIPRDTFFAAAEHDTVSDQVIILDEAAIPDSHAYELQRFKEACEEAGAASRRERASTLDATSPQSLSARARDWAEVRPEWGLAGNAALLVAPRARSRANLSGRVFLHDYDASQDPDQRLLEQIMSGPLIVAHWINMQYYTSAVDNRAFGSGTKTLHNVTGLIGLQSGAEGDLKFGLPTQAVADHSGIRHEPIRLQAILAASRRAIDTVLARHPGLEDLSNNEWMTMIAWEDDRFFQRNRNGEWLQLPHTGNMEATETVSDTTTGGERSVPAMEAEASH